MKKLEKDIVFISILYINLIFIAWLLIPCYLIQNFDYIYVSLLIIIGSAIFLAYRYLITKWFYRISITFSFICLLLIYLYVKRKWTVSFVQVIYIDFNKIIDEIYNGTPTYFAQMKPIAGAIVPAAVLILLLIISAGFYEVTVLGVLTLVIVLWYSGFSVIIKERLFGFVFISAITFTINSHLRTLKSLDRKGIKTAVSKREFVLYSIICSLVIASLMPLIRNTSPGKYSSVIKAKFENKLNGEEGGGGAQGRAEYNLASSGYNDSSTKLGGPVSIDDDLRLKVKSDKPLYLRGTVKNYYDGFTWTRKNVKMNKKEKQELLPQTGANMFVMFNKISKLSVYPVDLKTTTIFAPEYVFNIDINGTDIFYDKDFTYKAEKPVTDAYSVTYTPYKQNLGVISNSSDGREYGEMDSEYAFSIKDRPDIMSKYSEYLQLPGNIPKRVYDLVGNITGGCSTNGEKVQKIYKYLKETYKYSLDVSEVPKDREFVDYFLFTEKKGYCTYFATAATIMCRIAGVPARYAEGFNMTDNKDSNGLFLVTNRNAHAWTEILLGPETNLWTILDCVPNAEEQMTQEISLNLKNDTALNNNNTQAPGARRNRDKDDTKESSNDTRGQGKYNLWEKLMLTALCGILLYFIVIYILKILRRYKIVRSKSIIPLYLYYLSLLKSAGYRRPENFGDMEFVHTIDDKALKDRLQSLVRAAYAEHFGGKKINDIDRKEYYRYITSYIKNERRKFR